MKQGHDHPGVSDAIPLGIALAARLIARRPTDEAMAFGDVRAEIPR